MYSIPEPEAIYRKKKRIRQISNEKRASVNTLGKAGIKDHYIASAFNGKTLII